MDHSPPDDAYSTPQKLHYQDKGGHIPESLLLIPAILNHYYDNLPPNETLFEGELSKYRPGIGHQYIQRWCTVSKVAFAYYKNAYNATHGASRPIVFISLMDIESVQRVLVDVPVKTKNEERLNQYQFEIFLKNQKHEEQQCPFE